MGTDIMKHPVYQTNEKIINESSLHTRIEMTILNTRWTTKTG